VIKILKHFAYYIKAKNYQTAGVYSNSEFTLLVETEVENFNMISKSEILTKLFYDKIDSEKK